MEELVKGLTLGERFLYLGLIPGIIFALITLIIGIVKGKKKLGIIGSIVCLIGGLGAGIAISGGGAAVFIYLIVRKEKRFEFKDDELLKDDDDEVEEE